MARRSSMFGVVLAAGLASAAAAPPAAGVCTLEPGPTRAVVRVIDGETLGLDDGTEVRLVGALAPRLLDAQVDLAFWTPEREARAELERTALGKSVDLGFAGLRGDRYGRLMAHVFVHVPDGRLWLQGHLLKTGHARAYAAADDARCFDELVAHERLGRESGRGLWGHAAYQIRPAERTRELLRYRSTYQIVDGRVVAVAAVRGQAFINFGADWREDFTAMVRPGDRRRLEASGLDVMTLKDRRVRVRGWIEWRGGPAIEVRHAGQIEVMDEPSSP